MQTVSSRAVAEMLGKRHDNFMRDIRKYVATLEEEAPKYFVEGTYTDGLGKTRAGYELTLAGCNLIAGRIIGVAGDEFRAKYVGLFETPKAEEPAVTPISNDLTVDEVAKRLGCSERNVYRMVKAGKLESIQKEILVPTTKTFIPEDAVVQYLSKIV